MHYGNLNHRGTFDDIYAMRFRAINLARALMLLAMTLPGAAAPAEQAGADGAAVRQLVHDWANAWGAGRFNEYTTYYVAGFTGTFASHAAWRESRRARIEGRTDLHVELGPVLVQFNFDDPDIARAIFLQSYKSSSFCDVVEKTLDLRRTASGWRISNERAETRNRC